MFKKFTYALYGHICALPEFLLKISIYFWKSIAITKTSISVPRGKFHILSKVKFSVGVDPGINVDFVKFIIKNKFTLISFFEMLTQS